MTVITQEDQVMKVEISGDIDHHTAREMRQSIDLELERVRPQELILDFKHVTFMDSSGIGLVMGRYKQMQALGGTLQVVNLSNHIRKVMVLAGLDKLAVLK
ncbi:MAG: STAS domain-containing protein [Massiliimalia sp.]